jgi:hypothetical protein
VVPRIRIKTSQIRNNVFFAVAHYMWPVQRGAGGELVAPNELVVGGAGQYYLDQGTPTLLLQAHNGQILNVLVADEKVLYMVRTSDVRFITEIL